MEFIIDDMLVVLEQHDNRFMLQTTDFKRSLFVPSGESAIQEIERNYWLVKNHFRNRGDGVVSDEDMRAVCLIITVNWFALYEKTTVKTIRDKDFEDSSSTEQLLWFFRRKYPDNYKDKLKAMRNWSGEEVQAYIEMKEQLDNR